MPGPSSPPPTDPLALRPLAADDRGSGPAVVLLHGQPGDRRDWDGVVAALGPPKSDALRLLIPDRPGYGETGGPAGGIEGNSDALVALLDRLDVERAVLVGHSWGGAVALDTAERHPSRVAALVLVASIGGEGSIEDFDRILGAPVVGPLIAYGGLLALSLSRVRRLLAPPEIADRLPSSWVLSWRSFVTEQRALTAELPAVTARLGMIEAPAQVVIGDADRVVNPRVQEALAEALPSASVIHVPGCGHLLPWEAPEVIAGAIRQASLTS